MRSDDPSVFSSDSEELETYWIRFKPAPDTFLRGTRPLALIHELYELGRAVDVYHSDDVPMLETYEPERVYSWWDMLLVTSQGENAIRDVFIFVEDEASLEIRLLGKGAVRGDDLFEMASIFQLIRSEESDASIFEWLKKTYAEKNSQKGAGQGQGQRPQTTSISPPFCGQHPCGRGPTGQACEHGR